jgi:hypothetical protein
MNATSASGLRKRSRRTAEQGSSRFAPRRARLRANLLAAWRWAAPLAPRTGSSGIDAERAFADRRRVASRVPLLSLLCDGSRAEQA